MSFASLFNTRVAPFQQKRIVVSLWHKTHKTNTKGVAPISLRITIDGKRSEVSTGIRVRPEQKDSQGRTLVPSEWDKVRGEIRGSAPAVVKLNEHLQLMMAHVLEVANLMKAHGRKVTAVTLSRQLKEPFVAESPCFIAMCEKQFHCHYTVSHPATRKAKEYGLTQLRLWHGKGVLPLEEFTRTRAQAFYMWLLDTRGIKPSSAGQILQSLGALFRLAVNEGLAELDQYPFRAIRRRKNPKVEPLRLSLTQFMQLRDAELPAHLQVARDVYVAQYYLYGSRIGAVLKLRRQDVDSDTVGVQAEKGGTYRRIVITPELQEVFDRQPGSSDPNALLFPLLRPDFFTLLPDQQLQERARVIANVGRHLKEVGQLLGIQGNLHSHTARHTLATHAADTGGIRIAQALLGHSSVQMTERYTGKAQDSALTSVAASIYALSAVAPVGPPVPEGPGARIIPFRKIQQSTHNGFRQKGGTAS